MSMALVQPAETGQAALLATFLVRDVLFGLDAAGIQEVIRLGPLTPVPRAPEEVLGIMNLRGRIVTILDVNLMLGFGKAITGPDSRVFIIEDRNEFIGLLVDRVGEAVEVDRDGLLPPPANLPQAQARFFTGVHRVGGRAISLMDVGQILAGKAQ